MWAPAGTPQPIIDTIAADVKVILEKPEVQKKAAELASTPAPMTPRQFADYIQSERQKWSEVVKAVGIQLGQ